jgi:hypothetical protein
MNAERFCEILMEYGYPLNLIKKFWDNGTFHDYDEKTLRGVAERCKQWGILEDDKRDLEH